MNKRPGHVQVTTEVAYCPFCNRTRTLRREEHRLGNLVRTIVTCESCHRTLSSTTGVATAATEPAAEPVAEEAPAAEEAAVKEEPVKTTSKPRRAPAKRATAVKKAAPPKPRSTAKTTRRK